MSPKHQPLNAIVSIHDVMPQTLKDIDGVLARLETLRVSPVTLLVVPGKNWKSWQLDWLRDQQQQGIILAGHGWHHQVAQRRTLYHKLHGVLLSRMVAEHLSLDEQGIAALINRCFDWFAVHDFAPPDLYVPPAWAMGRIQLRSLDCLPFQFYEFLSGVYRRGQRDVVSLPLTGYEADTGLRTVILAAWNHASAVRARHSGRPLRIAIHPGDLSLGLSGQLDTQLRAADRFITHSEAASLFGNPAVEAARLTSAN